MIIIWIGELKIYYCINLISFFLLYMWLLEYLKLHVWPHSMAFTLFYLHNADVVSILSVSARITIETKVQPNHNHVIPGFKWCFDSFLSWRPL